MLLKATREDILYMEREKRKGVNIVRDFLCNKEYLDGTIKYEVGHIAKLEEELASRQNDIKNGNFGMELKQYWE